MIGAILVILNTIPFYQIFLIFVALLLVMGLLPAISASIDYFSKLRFSKSSLEQENLIKPQGLKRSISNEVFEQKKVARIGEYGSCNDNSRKTRENRSLST